MALLKLARITDDRKLEGTALDNFGTVLDVMGRFSLGAGNWLSALDFKLSKVKEIAVIGPCRAAETGELLNAISRHWIPNKVVAALDTETGPADMDIKLLADKKMVQDKPTVYICENFTCKQPVTDVESLEKLLKNGE
jgi:uncharacterized protein YyaL (SSP411 family)